MKNKSKYIYALGTMLLFAITVNAVVFIVSRPSDKKEEIHYSFPKNTMKQEDAESVIAVIQANNFDEAFSHYSTYKDIQDTRFHELRRAYLNSREELMEYINEAAHNKTEVPYYLRSYKNESGN